MIALASFSVFTRMWRALYSVLLPVARLGGLDLLVLGPRLLVGRGVGLDEVVEVGADQELLLGHVELGLHLGALVQALLDRLLRQHLAGDEHVLHLLAELRRVLLLALLKLRLDDVVHPRLGDGNAVHNGDVGVLGMDGGQDQRAGQA